jgi:hypothetical protein
MAFHMNYEMNKAKKGSRKNRNVKFVKNRKRFNVLFIFLGFFNDNNTIQESVYLLISENP